MYVYMSFHIVCNQSITTLISFHLIHPFIQPFIHLSFHWMYVKMSFHMQPIIYYIDFNPFNSSIHSFIHWMYVYMSFHMQPIFYCIDFNPFNSSIHSFIGFNLMLSNELNSNQLDLFIYYIGVPCTRGTCY